jgi:hypothetical protein
LRTEHADAVKGGDFGFRKLAHCSRWNIPRMQIKIEGVPRGTIDELADIDRDFDFKFPANEANFRHDLGKSL